MNISSGSTVAEIEPWALETLSIGDHTITFRYEDGEASADFTVQKALPPTGDRSDPALWLLLVVLGMAGITMAGVRMRAARKKR